MAFAVYSRPIWSTHFSVTHNYCFMCFISQHSIYHVAYWPTPSLVLQYYLMLPYKAARTDWGGERQSHVNMFYRWQRSHRDSRQNSQGGYKNFLSHMCTSKICILILKHKQTKKHQMETERGSIICIRLYIENIYQIEIVFWENVKSHDCVCICSSKPNSQRFIYSTVVGSTFTVTAVCVPKILSLISVIWTAVSCLKEPLTYYLTFQLTH